MKQIIVDKIVYGGMLVEKYFLILDDGTDLQVPYREWELYNKGDEYPKRLPDSFNQAVKDIEQGKTVPLDTALNEKPPTESETFKKICKEIQELFDKIEALELRNHVLTVANDDLDEELTRTLKAWTEAVTERTEALLERDEARGLFQTGMELSKKYKDERDEYKIGYDRYEKLRRSTPAQFAELYKKNLTSGVSFDTLVDQL
jgi:regulator of replication initiation timing